MLKGGESFKVGLFNYDWQSEVSVSKAHNLGYLMSIYIFQREKKRGVTKL